jgi:hypothetical protein
LGWGLQFEDWAQRNLTAFRNVEFAFPVLPPEPLISNVAPGGVLAIVNFSACVSAASSNSAGSTSDA